MSTEERPPKFYKRLGDILVKIGRENIRPSSQSINQSINTLLLHPPIPTPI